MNFQIQTFKKRLVAANVCMSHQSEAILEANLIKQLLGLGYVSVKIQDGEAFLSNLKTQLEVIQ